ncbi:TRAP transporter large permease [Dehalococcoidia bacterium]|nr:TRAP transporter large permease [Dehalococcoidia bacterium]
MEITIIGFSVLLVMLIMGMPIAMAFGLLAVFLTLGFEMCPAFLMPVTFVQIRSIILLAVPLFILMGGLLNMSGMTPKLVAFVEAFIGHVKGGLGAVVVVTCALFGAVSGAISAAIACIGTTMIPRMEERGYPRGYATGLIACAGVLGQLIPPCVPRIFFALLTGQSLLAVWLASVGPAVLLVIIFCIINFYLSAKFPLVLLPKLDFREHAKVAAKASYRSIPVLIIAVIILGGIYGGICTPTEAAVLGVFYILVIGCFAYRSIALRALGRMVITAASTSGVIMIMLFFILITSRILTVEFIPQRMADVVVGISPNVYVTLLMANFILLLIGMLMDDLSGTLLAATIVYPIVAEMGVCPVHFSAITSVNLALGTLTPPCAPMLFLAGRIGNCPPEQFMKPALTFMLLGLLPVLIATTFWPDLSLFLPRLAGFH